MYIVLGAGQGLSNYQGDLLVSLTELLLPAKALPYHH